MAWVLRDNMWTITSKEVAESFDKPHKQVLERIRRTYDSIKDDVKEDTYTDRGREYPLYHMNIDAFNKVTENYDPSIKVDVIGKVLDKVEDNNLFDIRYNPDKKVGYINLHDIAEDAWTNESILRDNIARIYEVLKMKVTFEPEDVVEINYGLAMLLDIPLLTKSKIQKSYHDFYGGLDMYNEDFAISAIDVLLTDYPVKNANIVRVLSDTLEQLGYENLEIECKDGTLLIEANYAGDEE